RRGAAELVFAVTVQAAIGIATLLSVVPISLGLLHQGGAVVVLTAAVFHAQRMQATRHAPSEAGAETQAAHTA
ncbi:MAG: COX15/CtaA family protein, partial [Rhizobiales bacterium]|nr:COX15/CtaA family protein [Hyphomicrobiales bacterium]